MIYLGKIAPHWREPYSGEYYSQVFLHYVRSRGDCSYAYFDKLNETTKPVIESSVPEEEPIIESKPEIKTPSSTSKKSLDDYIFTLDNVVSDELCDRILEEYRNCDFWIPTSIGSGNIDDQIRNCDTINISENIVLQKNFDVRKK